MTDPATPVRGPEREESLGGRAQRAAEKYILTLPTDRPGLAVRDFRKGYEQAAKEFIKERDEARARAGKAEQAASDLATKHGGKSAGQMYGPANCSSCKVLSNDYFLVGKGQLCMECWGEFPGIISERDEARRERDGARAAIEDRDRVHAEHVQQLEAERLRLRAKLEIAREALETINGKRGMTQLSDCCVAKTCIPHFTQQGEVSGCKWQAGVARGFSECADIAEQALRKVDPKNPVRLVEGGEK